MTRLPEYSRVLDPQALFKCFLNWIASITQALGAQVIPIDVSNCVSPLTAIRAAILKAELHSVG